MSKVETDEVRTAVYDHMGNNWVSRLNDKQDRNRNQDDVVERAIVVKEGIVSDIYEFCASGDKYQLLHYFPRYTPEGSDVKNGWSVVVEQSNNFHDILQEIADIRECDLDYRDLNISERKVEGTISSLFENIETNS